MQYGKWRLNVREVSAGDFVIPLWDRSNSQQAIQTEFPERSNKK